MKLPIFTDKNAVGVNGKFFMSQNDYACLIRGKRITTTGVT